ncbi:hypothetical protein B0H11DRAFT_2228953 [Mycena galericulata]|nr:hypothetical protein B0H11DRAFT_2228953 [Mycena galericulata]
MLLSPPLPILFDLCCDDTFRLTTGARVLFAFRQLTTDLIDKPVARCLSWTRSYCVLESFLEAAVFLIQKHCPESAGTRILDLWLALLCTAHVSTHTDNTYIDR